MTVGRPLCSKKRYETYWTETESRENFRDSQKDTEHIRFRERGKYNIRTGTCLLTNRTHLHTKL